MPFAEERLGRLRLALPKGRLQAGVDRLFADAGIAIRAGSRGYRPTLSIEGVDAKLLKPQSIVGMLAEGARDIGFAGADWVAEQGVELVELLDTGLDPVRLVVAAPSAAISDGSLRQRVDGAPLVVATEYARLAAKWIAERGLHARVLRTFGATEVFPPEDADAIVDNTSSGDTLRENGLVVIDEVMRSTTRLYASPRALEDRELRRRIDDLVVAFRAVLDARGRMMLELNVDTARLDGVLDALPCMRQPTIATLRGNSGYAVRAAVPRSALATLIPRLKLLGGTDVVVSQVALLVP
jgi:ATP phosphoribosyltransferase